MENACVLCFNLVMLNKPHPSLKKISELNNSELYKCSCCFAFLHKSNGIWEVISGGDYPREGYSCDLSDTANGAHENPADTAP